MCTRAVCGLAHYLEREGIPTTAIGAIRDHVALIRPPRALVVPFELWRPFGAPNAPAFQRRVLTAALELLERTDGPILVDFPDEAPTPAADLASWAPPVLPPHLKSGPGQGGDFAAAVRSEIAALRQFRDRWVRDHGGKGFDRITGLDPTDIVALILAYMRDQTIENPLPAFALDRTIKYATDDLKHFYYQAGLSQPGRITDIKLDDWFFGETLGGELLLRLRAALRKSGDSSVRESAEIALIPSHQAHRNPPE
jgi:hypothetical protein